MNKKLTLSKQNAFVTLFIMTLLAFSNNVFAHAKQENYIWLNVDEDAIVGRVEINVNDLRDKLGIDVDATGDNRIEGLKASSDSIQAFIKENFTLSDEQGELSYTFGEPSLFQEGNDFLQFPYRTDRLPVSSVITIENSLFLVPPYSDQDRFHRSMIVAEYNNVSGETFNQSNVAIVFTPNRLVQTLDIENPGSILNWKDFLWQGIVHIAIGLDHILFLVLLLLSAVVKYENKRWVPVASFKAALFNTIKIVTIFTVAHSITLSLAALDLVNVPSAAVESIIALSIIAMAFNNLVPVFRAHSWVLIFAFGLFHGLGFASVMGDLQFRVGFLERILLMFNIGVEVGQITIVILLLPVLYFLSRKALYQPYILRGVSLVAIVISSYWVLERTGILSA